MKFPYLLIILVFAFSCGTKPKPDQQNELSKRYSESLYPFGTFAEWPSDHDCDAMLWAGLAARAGFTVDLSVGMTPEGRPMRRPGHDCLPGESAATTSNDMILGLLAGLHAQRNLGLLQTLYGYGKSNSWVMGTPIHMIGRVVLKPNNISLLARTIKHLGGPSYPEWQIPLVYVPLSDMDYPTHLQLVSIMLARDVGETSVLNEVIVQQTCSYNQDDALAMAVCGDFRRATELLLGDYQYPGYVRGSEAYKRVHWTLAAKLVLEAN